MSDPLSRRLERLSPEQRRLLLEKLRQHRQPATTPLPRAPREQPPPLSHQQRRLWFLERLEGESPVYNVGTALRLRGRLEQRALAEALAALAARHEILRTHFQARNDEAVQIISPPGEIPLPVTTVTDETALMAHVETLYRQTFSLRRPPLWRAALLQLADAHHVLVFSFHHAIIDGWSLGILLRELAVLYGAARHGAPDPLPALPVQYADVAIWQQQQASEGALQGELDFWLEQLAGAPRLLELPTDHPRPPVQDFRGASRRFHIDAELSGRLRQLARAHGASLFMVLLAGFALLLGRLSASPEVLIGTPVANRPRRELEDLIGFFVNTLPIRIRLPTGTSVTALLARVRDTTLSALDHQALPFEQLVEYLNPPRSLAHHPLFQVMFVLQNTPPDEARHNQFPGLAVEPLGSGSASAKFDLLLSLEETAEGLGGEFEYSRALFEPATVARLAGYYRHVLTALCDAPGQPLEQVSLLDPAARERLLRHWNDTAVPCPADTLHGALAAQCRRTPDAVALLDGDRRLSFAELDARANRLAHRLLALGVVPEARIGVCIPRSLEMVVALLATLKAGGAYVPLDPDYPPARLGYIASDAGLTALLSLVSLDTHWLPAAVPVLALDDPATSAAQPDHDPARPVDPWQAAYVFYTSGSTGQPRGVVGHHQGMINRFHWMWRRFPFQPGEVCAQKTALNFGDSVWELWGPLLQGVPLVLVPEAVLRDIPALVALLAREGVSRLVLVPSLLRVLLEEADLGRRLARLRLWVSSGEALPPELSARFRRAFPGATLLNLYGATEVSMDITGFELLPGCQSERPLPIGKPIDNCRAYILDRRLRPVPPGVPGDLYVAGIGLARGYLRRPGLTAERFIPDPFDAHGGRLFATGDRARFHADGEIEYLGRRDFQVKIRGFRIEPAEVEAALAGHPAVRRQVVLAREDRPGERRLVAYLVSGEPRPTVAELRAHLKAQLPDFMVPAAFVFLDVLPLNPSGKLDRPALPAPDREAGDDAAYLPPRTPLEKTVVDLWQEVLGLERVSVLDNFFELGGHSLLATRLMGRLARALDRELPLRLLFEYPTPEALARALLDQRPVS